MLEDLINQQWQALKRLVRESKLFGHSKNGTLTGPGMNRQKPSLADAVMRRRKADALDEYRRRFASGEGVSAPVPAPMPVAPQGFNAPPQVPYEPVRPPSPALVRAPIPETLSPPSPFFRAPAPEPMAAQLPGPVTMRQPEPAKAPPPAEPSGLPDRVQNAERQRRRLKAANQSRPPKPSWSSRLGEALNNLPPSLAHDLRMLRQRKNEFIAAAAACIVVFGGAYFYRGMHTDRGKPVQVSHAVPVPAREPEKAIAEERPKKPAGPNKKAYYDRLLPGAVPAADETPAAPAMAAPVMEAPKDSSSAAQEKAAQPEQAKVQDEPPASVSAPAATAAPAAPVAVAAPVAASVQVSASEPVTAPVAAPAASPATVAPIAVAVAEPAAVAKSDLAADRPTWVKSERYLPDGTRTDTPRPAAGPAGSLPGEGEARKPVLAAVGPAAAMSGEEAPGTKGNASPTPAKAPAPASTSAEPPQTALTGYFAQVKSDQNRKAAEAELAAVAEKYRGVLGAMQLITRSADLKDRGTWFRVLIGPVKSHDDADNLCKRLKGAGLQDCIVQKLD